MHGIVVCRIPTCGSRHARGSASTTCSTCSSYAQAEKLAGRGYVVGQQSRDISTSIFEVSDADNLEFAAAFFACEVPVFTSVSDTTFYLQPTRAQELLAYPQPCQLHEPNP
jgi:hypothetical protein